MCIIYDELYLRNTLILNVNMDVFTIRIGTLVDGFSPLMLSKKNLNSSQDKAASCDEKEDCSNGSKKLRISDYQQAKENKKQADT